MNLPENVEKYLKKHSVPKWNIELSKDGKYDNIIVIPAISEFENIKFVLGSLIENDAKYFSSTLVVFVINNLETSEERIKSDNEISLYFLRNIINGQANDDLSAALISSDLTIGLVDASSRGEELPENHGGVGLARKIGMDLALTLFNYENSNKKILICTDADCTFDKNYLTEIVSNFNKKKLSAAVVNYRHDTSGNNENTKAIICYEYYLRYYVLFQRYADSHFAFHTIGSTMCCDCESYIKVEGINKKKAAEDFYFLEKLAKQVKIEKITSTTVYPSGRGSWRVPFGTGQRVNRYLAKEQDEYLLYNPANFEILKKWNEALYKNSDLVSYYLEAGENIHPELYKFLIKQEFDRAFSKILNRTNDVKQINNQKKFWFDGFRTLKLIHYLRDAVNPNINAFDAIDILFEKLGISVDIKRDKGTIPELEMQKKYLEVLRKLDNEDLSYDN
jgi:hypothetical protein